MRLIITPFSFILIVVHFIGELTIVCLYRISNKIASIWININGIFCLSISWFIKFTMKIPSKFSFFFIGIDYAIAYGIIIFKLLFIDITEVHGAFYSPNYTIFFILSILFIIVNILNLLYFLLYDWRHSWKFLKFNPVLQYLFWILHK